MKEAVICFLVTFAVTIGLIGVLSGLVGIEELIKDPETTELNGCGK